VLECGRGLFVGVLRFIEPGLCRRAELCAGGRGGAGGSDKWSVISAAPRWRPRGRAPGQHPRAAHRALWVLAPWQTGGAQTERSEQRERVSPRSLSLTDPRRMRRLVPPGFAIFFGAPLMPGGLRTSPSSRVY
jgi:hypothetical protein